MRPENPFSEHDPTILEQNDDRTDVHVICSCNEWEFRGDWDDMAAAWFEHERHPDFHHLYVGRGTRIFFSRAGEQAIADLMERRSGDAASD